jgi:hypothetical protein
LNGTVKIYLSAPASCIPGSYSLATVYNLSNSSEDCA